MRCIYFRLNIGLAQTYGVHAWIIKPKKGDIKSTNRTKIDGIILRYLESHVNFGTHLFTLIVKIILSFVMKYV